MKKVVKESLQVYAIFEKFVLWLLDVGYHSEEGANEIGKGNHQGQSGNYRDR